MRLCQHKIGYFWNILVWPFYCIASRHQILIIILANKFSLSYIFYIFTLDLSFRNQNDAPFLVIIKNLYYTSIRNDTRFFNKQGLPESRVNLLESIIYLFLCNTCSIPECQLRIIHLKLFIYGFLDFADSRIMKFCVSTEDTNYSMTSFLLDS